MNWLEQAIEAISPAWAESRHRNRLLIKGYEAAKVSRTHKPKREGRSMDTAVGFAGASLREQARWLDQNHDLVIGLLDRMEERVVGKNGISIEPMPLTLAGDRHDKLGKEIRRRYAAWSLKPEVTGRLSRPEMERLVCRTWLRDGEVFAQQLMGKVPKLVHPSGGQYSLELLEPEFVPLDLSGTYQGSALKQGCALNSWGQITAFAVYKHHPRESHDRAIKLVPAARMLHLAHRRNLRQLRGISLMHGIITRLSDLKDYEEAERVAARISAALAVAIKRGDPQMYDPEKYDANAKARTFNFSPGMIVDNLGPGEDLEVIESNRPNTHLTEFRSGQLRAVASGSRSGYSSIAREYKGNFSAQRQELVEQFEGFGVLQVNFTDNWVRPNYRAWLEMETLRRDDPLVLPTDLDLETLFDAQYLAPVMPWIDPVKEASGWRQRIRGGGATQSQWIRAGGDNPDEVMAARDAEMKRNRAKGMVFDTDAGQVSNAGVAHASTSILNDEGNSEDE